MTEQESPDVIPVREGEDFDHQRVAEFLRGKLPGTDQPMEVVQFGGGHANLTYLLRFGTHEYVLRRPPIGPVAESAHDMNREYRALSALYKGYPYAPRAYVFCDDPSIIGATFFVMERRYGTVVRRAIPPQYGGGEDAVANRKMSEAMIDALADLHEVDYAAIGLDQLGKPEGFLRRQVNGWANRYERAKTREIPLVGELTRWLADHLPESPRPTLLHNDFRLDNIMLDSNDPGRVVAVFDWDMCTVGDPLADLGTLLATWTEEGESIMGISSMPSTVPGFLKRREAIERYAQRRNVDIENINYYFVFGTFKLGVVLQQIYFRYHRGQTRDSRFQGFDQIAEYLFRFAEHRIRRPV